MISSRAIIRGALTRTFPASLLAIASMMGFALAAGTPLTVLRVVLPLAASLGIAAGSAAVLLAFRRRLDPDAGVGGRRAIIVGLGALALGLTAREFISSVGNVGEQLMMVASGAGVALAMFWPWMSFSRASARIQFGVDAVEAITAGDIRMHDEVKTREPVGSRPSGK